MPPRVLSEAEVDAFRAELCSAAEQRFAEAGYAGVTLRGLAAELGCSPMTPYRYFRNKQHIFAAVRAAALARFADRVEAAARAEGDPLERIWAAGRCYVRFACDEPDAFRIMFDLQQPDSQEYPEVARETERAWGALRDSVAAAVDSGHLVGDPEVLAHLCWASVHGLATLHLAGRLDMGRELDDLVEPMMRVLGRGSAPELT